jgi:hypothetical protein
MAVATSVFIVFSFGPIGPDGAIFVTAGRMCNAQYFETAVIGR